MAEHACNTPGGGVSPSPNFCRRDAALGGVAMLLLGATAAASAQSEGLDAELLALCREFDVHREHIDRLSLAEGGAEARQAISALVDRGWEIRTAVTDLPAHTREGLLAKAKLALWETCDGDPDDGPTEGSGTQVAWSLAQDVLRAGL